ncbi:MAG: VWA domain-containing protein [Peptococcaceae bacterium]|jgi:hypothetical protein|nr:MAG: VWA domain-containing protein [Peptococcaceae bacterium]
MQNLKNELSRGYSEYWRKNKSAIEPRELAYALRALRKVGRYITANIKNMEWSGMSGSTKENIHIDPILAMGHYPIPPGQMDILVGLAAHEAFHCKELSDWVWLNVESKVKDLHPTYKALLRLMVDVGEDIFVKHVTQDSIWQKYMEKAWGYRHAKEARDLSLPPTPKCLFQVWGEILLEGRMHDNLHFDYIEPLTDLLASTEEIINSKEKGSISSRSKHRSNIYLVLWEQVSRHIKEWELEEFFDPAGVDMIQDERGRKEPGESPQETGENDREQDPGPAGGKRNLGDLADQIKNILDETEEKSLQEEIESVCGEYTAGILETVFGNATLPCMMEPDPELVRRLKRTFDLQKSTKPDSFRMNRGLFYGKIDGRRLYKAPINGRVFKKKELTVLNNAWNITILVDASASMKGGSGTGGKEWAIAEKTFVSLYEAARESGNRLDVLSYLEAGGRCEVSRLLRRNRLYTVIPNGRTPTGQAILAAALKTPKDKKRLLIHITDGEPNCGINVEEAVTFCEKDGIDLITIGCYYSEEIKEQFQSQYKDKLYLMDSVEMLPDGLETMLRRKLLRKRN